MRNFNENIQLLMKQMSYAPRVRAGVTYSYHGYDLEGERPQYFVSQKVIKLLQSRAVNLSVGIALP
jgi:hypothetical protein